METVEKKAWEDLQMEHQFKRVPGAGWVSASETITAAVIACFQKSNGRDYSAAMIHDISYAGSLVTYWITGGIPGQSYIVRIRATSSLSQDLEDWVEFSILSFPLTATSTTTTTSTTRSTTSTCSTTTSTAAP